MQTTTVKVNSSTVASITFAENDNGIVTITVDPRHYIDASRINLVVKNVGLPGIIGPDLEFNIWELCEKEREAAQVEDWAIKHDDPQKDAKRMIPLLIDSDLSDAVKTISLNGFIARVVEQDGAPKQIYSEINNNRINLRVTGGKVKSAYVG